MRDERVNKIEIKKTYLKPIKRDSIPERKNKINQDSIQEIKNSLTELIHKIQLIELGEINNQEEENMKKRILVQYKSGESRYLKMSIDYMKVFIDGYELYAEICPDPNDEVGTYEKLKGKIIEQAEENDIDANELMFWFD